MALFLLRSRPLSVGDRWLDERAEGARKELLDGVGIPAAVTDQSPLLQRQGHHADLIPSDEKIAAADVCRRIRGEENDHCPDHRRVAIATARPFGRPLSLLTLVTGQGVTFLREHL